ncbi:DNA methyltransferase [Aurantimonas sp. HBX-1]|uniref:Eco57I restriction-modification methylase domain-containing protein n=1 Tax=Aurantimonas sp. HBX-1 TaxID=2906072 RepID=UPI001F1FFDA8|nr:DNA methyltransferase [Aurantimonas sp. HBX-1]UIJ72363.1 hypothetical protein LXB15_01465 [Aurantimonas sp. HBX-1]
MSNDHEWLNLIEVSGPFLAVPVLREVFPQGLEALPSGRPQRLRRTYEEWRDAVDMDDLDLPALHAAWIDDVLVTALEMDETVLRKGATLPEQLTVSMPEHGVTVAPDLAVVNPTNSDDPLLLIHVYQPDTDLDATRRFDGLAITPADRMVALLRATGCPTGIVTNGERWMLVHAPVGAVAGFASWYARLWGQEPETLRAFVSLLGIRRFFGPEEAKLPALYERSLKHQDDVTEALGEQVRRAVEVLVQALDRADQDRNRELLRDVDPRELYEAGLTVMMRLVFLLSAEERALLLLGDPRYDSFYAISSLRMQLRADSEEILERRRSAWCRLLALFRGVYGGIDHPTLRLPALGGSLFDPDRYPFLEGRQKGTSWRSDPAEPLPIDDRTVLLLLEAIQTFEGRTLSYRALDVEQIGHVYEGLLERTVKRVDDVTLELDSGAKAKSPRVTLGEVESARLDGPARVAELLKERSERSESAIRSALERAADDRLAARLLTVCRGDIGLRDRILPYAPLLRTDPWGYPLVHHKGAFVVVLGAERRESGTHYTPKSLTEKIVEETLTPAAYRGPAEGKAPEDWELRSAEELLDLKICDPAMGSGAFLVQACRWLSDRLVEAWSVTEASGKRIDSEGRLLDEGDGEGFEPLSQDAEERAVIARRLVAERCLYGVDKNPLAVELAKLSLWLTTTSKGRPFGFLDHNLRSGDSLLGIHDLGQLVELDMSPKGKTQLRLFGRTIRLAIDKALELRARLRDIRIRDIKDVEAMAALDTQSRGELALPTLIADAFVGIILAEDRAGERTARIETLAAFADAMVSGENSKKDRVRRDASTDLAKDSLDSTARHPFHWPLEFPEVFDRENGGFDAIVGNPPFLGNRLWKGALGERFQWQCQLVLGVSPAKIDLCVVFHRRAADLMRRGGSYGLLATSNIAEGSAIVLGLGEIVKRGSIYFARKGMPWPGTAAVVVAVVGFFKGEWNGRNDADGHDCDRIGPRLEPEEANSWAPVALSDGIFSFAGVDNSKGLAFVITPDHPWFERLKDEPNSLLRPYVTGDDITSSALNDVARWALDIADRELGDIQRDWPEAYQFITEVVQPTRTPEALKSYKGLIDRWWQFWNHRADLMRRIRQNERFIAYSKVTKHPICMLAPSDWIYTNKVVLIGFERDDLFPICLSTPFRSWLEAYSGAGLGVTLQLSISESIAKFPLPSGAVSQEGVDAALRFNDIAVAWSADHQCGLTDLMNAVHSPDNDDSRIAELRVLFETLDRHVAAAFGWADLDVSYDFHEVNASSGSTQWRYSLSEEIREELLRRLVALNKAQHEEEIVKQSDAGKSGSGKARGRRRRNSETPDFTLDLDDVLLKINDRGA